MTAGQVNGSQLFAVMSRPTDQWRDDPSLLADHVSFLQDLERQGVTFLSGPLGLDVTGWRGHGRRADRQGRSRLDGYLAAARLVTAQEAS